MLYKFIYVIIFFWRITFNSSWFRLYKGISIAPTGAFEINHLCPVLSLSESRLRCKS